MLELCERESLPHSVQDLSLTDVYRADEMFCTGTMGELAAVTAVDGRRIGNGEVGPMTRRLSELYASLTAREGTKAYKWGETLSEQEKGQRLQEIIRLQERIGGDPTALSHCVNASAD